VKTGPGGCKSAECEVKSQKKGKKWMSDLKKIQNKNFRSQKKVETKCPILPEMEKGMTNLMKQTKDK